ncbi:MAG: HIT family protein [Bacteroidetes bacterium]|nr:HIT family protein [Bacteroidota bacterium]
MPSIFSKIVAGEIPCYKIAENEHCFAFLDIHPLTKGHSLVVPKKEIDYLYDLDEASYQELMRFTKRVAQAIKKSIPCQRVASVVLGFEVPHAHIHLIPANHERDAHFSNKKITLSKEEYTEIAQKIAAAF